MPVNLSALSVLRRAEQIALNGHLQAGQGDASGDPMYSGMVGGRSLCCIIGASLPLKTRNEIKRADDNNTALNAEFLRKYEIRLFENTDLTDLIGLQRLHDALTHVKMKRSEIAGFFRILRTNWGNYREEIRRLPRQKHIESRRKTALRLMRRILKDNGVKLVVQA